MRVVAAFEGSDFGVVCTEDLVEEVVDGLEENGLAGGFTGSTTVLPLVGTELTVEETLVGVRAVVVTMEVGGRDGVREFGVGVLVPLLPLPFLLPAPLP